MRKRLLLLGLILLLFLGCIFWGEDRYYEIDPAYLTDADRARIPHKIGDTLKLVSANTTIVAVVDTVFERIEEEQKGYEIHPRTPTNIPYQDIEYRYVHFRESDSIGLVVAPESSLSWPSLYMFFRHTLFGRFSFHEELDSLTVKGVVYDSVYVMPGRYGNSNDTLWYARNAGIIGVLYHGEQFWKVD